VFRGVPQVWGGKTGIPFRGGPKNGFLAAKTDVPRGRARPAAKVCLPFKGGKSKRTLRGKVFDGLGKGIRGEGGRVKEVTPKSEGELKWHRRGTGSSSAGSGEE